MSGRHSAVEQLEYPLLLPSRRARRVWTWAEFTCLLAVTLAGIKVGLDSPDGDQLAVSVFIFLFLNGTFGYFNSQRATITQTMVTIESGVLRRRVATTSIRKLTSVTFGSLRVRLNSGKKLTIRWWPLTWIGGSGEIDGIEDFMQEHLRSESHPSGQQQSFAPAITTTLIRWRLVYWIVLLLVSPLPYLLGTIVGGK